jgi:hypothetical protein
LLVTHQRAEGFESTRGVFQEAQVGLQVEQLPRQGDLSTRVTVLLEPGQDPHPSQVLDPVRVQ